jgi:hypothetical protein
MCPELICEAEIICDQFSQTLSSYSKIYKAINRKEKLSDQQIVQLGKLF